MIERYKPRERIPERPEKREHRKERRKRREIVHEWFKYAFLFVKTKRAAIKYVRERKKDREYIEKIEIQEKIREKINAKREKEEKVQTPIVVESAKSSIFSMSKQRKQPGTSGVRLDEIVKEYNTKRTIPLPPQVKQQGKRPYDGEKYYSKLQQNSEIELHIGNCFLRILDEDTNLSLEFEGNDLKLCLTTLLDEMSGFFLVGEYSVAINDQTKKTEILKSGIKTNFSESKDSKSDKAVRLKFSHRPGEILIPNDIYNSLNMYEVKCEVAPIIINYNHNTLTHFFLIKEALEINKSFRENFNMKIIKAFKRHLKKNKLPKVFGDDLKNYIRCKKLANSLIDLQKNFEEKVFDLNLKVSPILYNFDIEVEGGQIKFSDFSPASLLSFNFPKIRIEAGKTKEATFLSGLGLSLSTSTTPSALYDFCATVSNIFCDKIKLIRTCTNFKKIS